MEAKYLDVDPWRIIERGWDPNNHPKSESIFSIGNGRMGQRANFEEQYSGRSLRGSYIAGVYYPDKTKVGWWKNGYPEYFAKVLNSINWIGLDIEIDGKAVDLAEMEVESFYRELNMKEGYLLRSFEAAFADGKRIAVQAQRFYSMTRDEIGTLSYSITPLNFNGTITFTPYLDFDVENEDTNWEEKFWDEVSKVSESGFAAVTAKTKKLDFHVTAAMRFKVLLDGAPQTPEVETLQRDKYVANRLQASAREGQTLTLQKYVGILSSLNHKISELEEKARQRATESIEAGFTALLQEQKEAWEARWNNGDIVIEGDAAAQQGIRFNIFHLHQTYTGEDERLNIGPKGFTGEKYSGSTYWDTEAYCLPFYLATADPRVGRNLLIYRYKHLQKVIENAEKLGFTNGAALYPMVTMNGEECHNEWEITFEEIHRNGAIAYAIYNYIQHTGEYAYLGEYGLEVLVAIARFWSQRVHFSEHKQQYVMHGVTGPNEYENNVNNNWYTNYIATWCMRYAGEAIDHVRENEPARWETLSATLRWDNRERERWNDIIGKMYYPVDEQRGVFLQQEGFLDKDLRSADALDDSERPINQHWSWDRILRSCFIKQADTLQGLYFFGHEFDRETLKRNFDFYEPMTVHESSLSPCIHVVLAAQLDYEDKALEMYHRTSRLDLDDYNREVHEGLHITSMAGTWISVVQGFGGMTVHDEQLHFDPYLPSEWEALNFRITWRGAQLAVKIDKEGTHIENEGPAEATLFLLGNEHRLAPGDTAVHSERIALRYEKIRLLRRTCRTDHCLCTQGKGISLSR